jgi:hypothetical protein
VAIHVMKLVKSKAARDEDFGSAVLGITEDAKDVARRYEGAVVDTNVGSGVVEICIAEGVNGPSKKDFMDAMTPSFGRHCSRVIREIDLPPEVYTK